MRDRFFPGMPLEVSVEYRRISGGTVIDSKTIHRCTEDDPKRTALILQDTGGIRSGENFFSTQSEPLCGALHSSGDGKLYLFYSAAEKDESGRHAKTLYMLREIYPYISDPVSFTLERNLTDFFTACERTGTEPSSVMDIFGTAGPLNSGDSAGAIRYVRITL